MALAACLRPPGVTASRRPGGRASDGYGADAAAFLAALPAGPPCPAVAKVDLGFPDTGRHPVMLEQQLQLARLGEQGHHGAADALDELRAAFIEALAGERDASGEFDDALGGAVDEVLAAPTAAEDRRCCGPPAREVLPPPSAPLAVARAVVTEHIDDDGALLLRYWRATGCGGPGRAG